MLIIKNIVIAFILRKMALYHLDFLRHNFISLILMIVFCILTFFAFIINIFEVVKLRVIHIEYGATYVRYKLDFVIFRAIEKLRPTK